MLLLLMAVTGALAQPERALCHLADAHQWVCAFDQHIVWPIEAVIALLDALKTHTHTRGFHPVTNASCTWQNTDGHEWTCTDRDNPDVLVRIQPAKAPVQDSWEQKMAIAVLFLISYPVLCEFLVFVGSYFFDETGKRQ